MHLERSENFARDVEPDGRTNFNLRKRHILVANGYAVTSADPAAGREDRTHGWLELVLDENGPRTVCRYDPRVAPERAGPIDYGHVLRFFAGQPDPADASHFTGPASSTAGRPTRASSSSRAKASGRRLPGDRRGS